MFTRSTDVFRVRQSLADLRAYLRESGRPVRDRLSHAMRGDLSPADALRRIDRVIDGQGGRFLNPIDEDVQEVCRLAAALPSDDYPAFTFATALLLADRLQSGEGDDDLYWNWESFRGEYALADPAVRAALMNGFRIGAEAGRVQLEDLPEPEACLTRTREEVLEGLAEGGQSELEAFVASDPAPERAGRAWMDVAATPVTDAAALAFRYLYERPVSLSPPRAGDAPLIPWIAR